MNDDLAGASPVDQPVRPRAWLWTDINGDTQVNVWEEPHGACEPLYDQSAVESLVNQYADDERQQAELRWASRVETLRAALEAVVRDWTEQFERNGPPRPRMGTPGARGTGA